MKEFVTYVFNLDEQEELKEYTPSQRFAVYLIKHKEQDNQTIGLLLCKRKDKLSIEWDLKETNNPIGVTSYEVRNELPKEILDRLPTEEDINKFIDMNE